MRVYLAGPLFNEAEQRFNRELRDELSKWFDVFLPQEDGQLLVNLVREGMPIEKAKAAVFAADISAIKSCDIVIIVLDGRCVDEGAAFEVGLAYGLGKRCWGIKTDVRQLLEFGDNPMIDSALEFRCSTVGDLLAHAENFVCSGRKPRGDVARAKRSRREAH